MRTHKSGRGFTLVELLVVIGIIAILISVLIPVLASARRAGWKTKCLGSLRQIGDGFKMYQNEQKGAWPVSAHFYTDPNGTGCDKRWHDFIARYVMGPQSVVDPASGTKYTSKDMNFNGTMGYPGSNNHQFEFGNPVDPVWIGTVRDRDNVLWGCPAWKGSYNIINNVDDYRIPGYTMNWFALSPNDLTSAGALDRTKLAYISTNTAANPAIWNGSYFKMTQWKQPAERVLIYDGTHPVGYFSIDLKKFPWDDATIPQVPPAASFSVDYNRHGKRKIGAKPREASLNVLYADGHAATVSTLECYRGMRFSQ